MLMSEFVQKRKEVADRQEILKTLKAIYQAEMSDEMEFDGEMWAAKKDTSMEKQVTTTESIVKSYSKANAKYMISSNASKIDIHHAQDRLENAIKSDAESSIKGKRKLSAPEVENYASGSAIAHAFAAAKETKSHSKNVYGIKCSAAIAPASNAGQTFNKMMGKTRV